MTLHLRDIASTRFGVHAKRLDHGKMALVQSSAILDGGIINHDYIARTAPETIRFKEVDLLQEGDVLLIGKGSSNIAAIWPGSSEDTVASSMLYVIRPDRSLVEPAYLAGYLNSRPAQAQMAAFVKRGTIPVLGRKALDELQVPVPPFEEQHKLMRLTDAMQRAQLIQEQLNQAYAQLLNAVWATYPER